MTALLASTGETPADGRGLTLDGFGPADPAGAQAGITLVQLANAKRLPERFLRDQGLLNTTWPANGSAPAVKIPYWGDHVHGKALTWRTRLSLSGADRFRSAPDRPLALYGLWRLDEMRAAGWCLVVEGETDALTAWYAGVPCIGIPGASAWKEVWSSELAGLDLVVVKEPDQGGAILVSHLASSLVGARVRVIEAGGLSRLAGAPVKDVSDLWRAVGDRTRFMHLVGRAREEASPVESGHSPLASPRQVSMNKLVLEMGEAGEFDAEVLGVREQSGLRDNQGVGVADEVVRGPWVGESLAEFLRDAPASLPWVLDRAIGKGSFVVALGSPESFKSMAMLHLGLSLAGGHLDWLGRTLGDPAPFIYVTNEKAKSSSQLRLRTMTAVLGTDRPVHIVYRKISSFEDEAAWRGLADLAVDLGEPLIVLDTLASIAGPGFDENSGRAMAAVVAASSRLTDVGATVVLIHHTAKSVEGPASRRLRGHGSLAAAMDGSVEFVRSGRANGGRIIFSPKDGEQSEVRFAWDPETFLLRRDDGGLHLNQARERLTLQRVVEVVRDLAVDGEVTAQAVCEATSYRKSTVNGVLKEAIAKGFICTNGALARATRYLPAVGAVT